MMKKLVKNKLFKNYISFLIPFFTIEILFRFLSNQTIIDWAIFRIFLSCNILSIFISVLTFFLGEKLEKVVNNLLMFIISFYAILQAGFKNYLGVYISLGASSQLGAVKDYIRDYFDSFQTLFYIMLIPFIIFFIYKIFIEKRIFHSYYKEYKTPFMKRTNHIALGISIFLILLLSVGYYVTLTTSFMQNKIQLESTYSLFKNPSNPNISVNQFGITAFGILDVKTTLIKEENSEILYFEKEENEVTDFTRHINDEAWIELNEKEKDKDFKTLNNYFLSRKITDKNEYTGTFKDKNLIVIMMESVNEIILHPEYYPTFNKIYTEGWSFQNSYSPRNSCATGNNEMSGMTSLYSIYRTCTANNYRKNVYNQAIFNLFNRAGYTTSSFHNYTEMYYYRSTIHENMGSSIYYGVEDLEIPYNSAYKEWPSDIDLMEEAMKRIDTKNPFMTWMTTVTSHQPYYTSSEYGDKYLEMFKDTDYPMDLKRYMSKLKELDLALERLLEILEEKNVLEDTVIVLYGDHYPYGLSTDHINYALDYNVKEKNNVDKTPFVIYNSEMEAEQFEEYTSYINILPTIANLFDLDYDPRLYMGEDILSPNYKDSSKNRVVLADGSWETRIGAYDATSGKMTYFGEERYTNEEIISYNKEINDMIKMSNLAITSNYFAYLSNALKELESAE